MPFSSSFTGCLDAWSAPDTYLLRNLEKGPKAIGIVSSGPKLAPHLGHKIEITGTFVAAKEAQVDPIVGKAPNYMKVSSIKIISTTCSQ